MPNMAERPGHRTMEMNGGSSVPHLACTPCVPLFVLWVIGVETEGLLDYQGQAGYHFHFAMEPSPGHIRCRDLASCSGKTVHINNGGGFYNCVFPVDSQSPNGKNISLHKKVGFPPIPERVSKRAENRTFCVKSAQKCGFQCFLALFFSNRRKPHWLCRSMF